MHRCNNVVVVVVFVACYCSSSETMKDRARKLLNTDDETVVDPCIKEIEEMLGNERRNRASIFVFH